MEQSIIQMLSYNLWANQQFSNWLKDLDEKLYASKVDNSFGSFSTTVHHIFKAETGWYNKLTSADGNIFPEYLETVSRAEQLQKLVVQSGVLVDYGRNLKQKEWQEKIHYHSAEKDYYPTRFQILTHVCNHSTYHRGQLITMAHQLNQKTFPSTDFIVFLRQFEQNA